MDLVAVYNARASLVQSLEASAMVRAKGGKEYRTRARESRATPAMIEFRAPAWLRLTGVIPFTAKRTFDIASDGREFRLLVLDRNAMRLVVGPVDAPATAPNPRRIAVIQPQQDIELEMKLLSLSLNPNIPPSKFRLAVPAGVPVTRVNETASAQQYKSD